MNNNYQHIEDLISKHLAGESSDDENLLLEKWIAEIDSNKKYFENLKSIFVESTSIKNLKEVDTDAAWKKLQEKISKTESDNNIRSISDNSNIESGSRFNFNTFLRIAATFIFVAGFSVLVYLKFQSGNAVQTAFINSDSTTKEILLPDSSTVLLNKNSSIEYSFSESGRDVKLTGEAFFDVKHDATKPFTVHAGELDVKDIGTSFNIKSDSLSDSIEVVVASGEVLLAIQNSPKVVVKKGEQTVYSKSTKTISKPAPLNANSIAYKTKVFVFENAMLEVAVKKLNEVYGSNIILSDNLKSCHLTATFKNEKLQSVVDVIAVTLELRIRKNGNEIILEGEGCE